MTDSGVDLYTEFYAITDALSAANVPFAVCGGVAVAIHGYPRFTKDVDLLILPEDEQRVLEVAAQRQFIFEGGRLPMGEGDVCDWTAWLWSALRRPPRTRTRRRASAASLNGLQRRRHPRTKSTAPHG